MTKTEVVIKKVAQLGLDWFSLKSWFFFSDIIDIEKTWGGINQREIL